MNRRQFLAAVPAVGVLAGCLSGADTEGATPTASVDDTPTPASGSSGTPESDGSTPAAETSTPDNPEAGSDGASANLAAFGTPSTICEEAIKPESGIDAVTEPAFASDWSAHEVGGAYRYDPMADGLTDEQTVIGLTTGDGARAYPLTVLNSHEVVNDTFGGPVLVTFCPLCRSGMVADRRIEGDVTTFAVSGLLWRPERIQTEASKQRNRTFGASATGGAETEVSNNGNLVMYDAATHSYWSQILATAICGPHAGRELDIVPSSVASWGEWRESHPETEVLLPPPHSGTVTPGTVLGTDGDTNGHSQ